LEQKRYFVDILYSPKADRYDVGQTENLARRLEFHNRGGVFSTKPLNWVLQTISRINRQIRLRVPNA